ncbi:uncharacterized protein LOC110097278 [Dendrobium catenatum]|uniref:uncharacterized protein LOC110097278 n=1 Tax=Dendrobium catenatum TaxID=906689 RepID=UPI0009F269EA|nr:uncharacterized protein LOC110097278 [Dendrobium catenatum]
MREDGMVNLDLDKAWGNIQKLDRALVGSLLGRRVPFWVVQNELQRKWGHLGLSQVTPLGADCFLGWFEDVDARDKVMLGGPWYVAGQIIGVEQWTIGARSRQGRKFSSPVWIRLPNLPLEYWDEANLVRMAAGVGEPLYMDKQTKRWDRCAFARVCVQLDLSKKLPKGVWANGLGGAFFQPVEYEGIPLICQACGKVGHKAEGCRESVPPAMWIHPAWGHEVPTANGQLKEMEVDRGNDGNVVNASGSIGGDSSTGNVDQGEWTIVNRRRRSRPTKFGAKPTDVNNAQLNMPRKATNSTTWKVVADGNVPKGNPMREGSSTGKESTMTPR